MFNDIVLFVINVVINFLFCVLVIVGNLLIFVLFVCILLLVLFLNVLLIGFVLIDFCVGLIV